MTVDNSSRSFRFSRATLAAWSAAPLRLIVGYGFIAHGWAKLARGPEHFIAILQALDIPAAGVLAWATILVELVGGGAVLAGAFIPLVSPPMAAILVVATATVHWQNGFSSIKLLAVGAGGPHFGPPGYETDLLYLACLSALALSGPGPFALTRVLSRSGGAEKNLPASKAVPPADHGASQ